MGDQVPRRREKRGTNKVFNVRDGLPPARSTQAILSANQVSGEGSLWGDVSQGRCRMASESEGGS